MIPWGIYTILFGGLFLYDTFQYVNHRFSLSTPASAGITAGAVFVLAGLIILSTKLLKKKTLSAFPFYGMLLFLFFLAIVFISRVVAFDVNHYSNELTGDLAIYESAFVDSDYAVGVKFLENPGLFLYKNLMHQFALWFGNNTNCALELGYTLFTIEAVLVFFAMSIYGGSLCGFLGGNLFYAYAGSLQWYTRVSVLHIGFIAFLILFLLQGALCRNLKKGDSAGFMGAFVLINLFNGILIYYSVLFAVPMILSFVALLMHRKEKERTIGKGMLVLLLLLAGSVGFFGMCFLQIVLYNTAYLSELYVFGKNVMELFDGFSLNRVLNMNYFGTACSLAFALFYTGFWFRDRYFGEYSGEKIHYAPFVTYLLLFVLMLFCGDEGISLIARFMLALTAGSVFGGLFGAVKKSGPVDYVPIPEPEPETVPEPVPEPSTATEPELDPAPESAPEPDSEPTSEPDANEQQDTLGILPGEPIPNPLPVPKKHEKKVLNYPHAVDKEQMHYDIETSSNDDFAL